MSGRRHLRTCTLCEAMCGLVITTEGDQVTDIRGDPDDPFSKGHICPKAVALQDVHTDPDRLRHPIRRVGDNWEEISWPEALQDAVEGIRRVQREHGRDAVAAYSGNPSVHSLGAILFLPPFLRALRTKNRYSATSVDQLPAHVVAQAMFGHALLIPLPDIDRTDHFLIFGANPAVSNGSLMTAPGAADRIAAIRARGGRVVLVDPRRTETAALADEHHFIRPGTDALLLLAMLHVVFEERLAHPGRLDAITDGIEELRAVARPYPPLRVAAVTGIEGATIERMAREFAAGARSVAYGRIGVSTQEFGGLATWLITALNLVCGRLDAEGGAMFTHPAVDVMGTGARSALGPRTARWKSRVRGFPEFGGEMPAAALAEEIDTPGEGQVRALVTHGGNPVLSLPNGARLDRALAGIEFFVAIDPYLNETTRHAHLILPPSSPLEREHYDVAFHLLAVRDTAKWSEPVFERPADARHDWEILGAMTAQLAGTWGARLRTAAMTRLGPRRLIDLALRRGPYGAGFVPFARGLSVGALSREPHGIDLGPLRPAFPARLRTHDRRIQAAPPSFVEDVARLEAAWFDADMSDGTLTLIGRRALRSNNSWMHNSERLVRGKRRCTLLMHPSDASPRTLADGDRVRIRSRVGEVEAELHLTDEVMPGVVCLPHGWGHGRTGSRMQVAAAHPGVSQNDLTDDQRVDLLTGNAAFSGVGVEVWSVARELA